MSDNRFDFLEIGDTRPPRPAPSSAPPPPPRPEPWSPPARSAAAPGEWRVVEVIGGPGSGFGQFAAPSGLAVDLAGNLYVADSYNHRVQRITPRGDVAPLGERGRGPGQFLNPQAVVVDAEQRIFVLEQGGCRVQAFDAGGEFLGAFGGPGMEASQLQAPTGMALGPCGNLFIADCGNRRVSKWTRAGYAIGIIALAPGGGSLFGSPQGVAVDRTTGRIFVADRPRGVLLVFTPDLQLEAALGGPGSGPGQFNEPQDVAVDDDGNLYVVEAGSDRLQILDARGRFRQMVTGAGELGGFSGPTGVAVSRRGALYVADTDNHRVFRLGRTGQEDAG